MANILIPIEIKDIGVDLQTAIEAWDEFYPIPEIEDPENPGEFIPRFSSRVKYIGYLLEVELLGKLDWALTQKSLKNKIVLTHDIFAQE